MSKRLVSLLVLVSACVPGVGQQNPPPNCQPITYFGVSGCLPSADGTCPAGYHKQAAGPTNPQVKAPIRLICVADNAPSKNPQSPEETVEAFYKWYVHALRQNREPLTQDEATLKKYVTSALIARIKKQMNSPDGLEADYFLQAQDYLDDWETNVSAAKAMIKGTVATTRVTLGAKDDSKHKLKVSLSKQGEEWKISRVQEIR
jgi:hypothetical protein